MNLNRLVMILHSVLADLIALIRGLIREGEGWLLPLVVALCLLALLWAIATPAGFASFIYPLL
jgi:hypothetical protein